MAAPALAPVLMTAAIGWIYYRRIRGSFGRQPWRPWRTGTRIALLTLVAAMMLAAAVIVPGAGLAVAGGAGVGAMLGAVALRHTHAGWHEGRRCYTPNPWIGAVLALLLLARLAWRMGSGVLADGAAQWGQNASPLTLAIGATLVSYYLVHGIGLALAMRRLAHAPQDATL